MPDPLPGVRTGDAPDQRHQGKNRLVGSVWVSTTRSAALSGRRSTDTEPEVVLRRALHAAGLRFRLHRRLAKGCTPDIVLPRRGVAVFVDGDYWHGCPVHFPDRQPAGPNADLWRVKFERTRERDKRANELAEAAGYRVVRIWECQIRSDLQAAVAQVVGAGV